MGTKRRRTNKREINEVDSYTVFLCSLFQMKHFMYLYLICSQTEHSAGYSWLLFFLQKQKRIIKLSEGKATEDERKEIKEAHEE